MGDLVTPSMKIKMLQIFINLVFVGKSLAENYRTEAQRMALEHERIHQAFEEEKRFLEQEFKDAESKGWNRKMEKIIKASAELQQEMEQMEEDMHTEIRKMGLNPKHEHEHDDHEVEHEHEAEHELIHRGYEEEKQALIQEFKDAESKGWNKKMEKVIDKAAHLEQEMQLADGIMHKKLRKRGLHPRHG